MKAPLRVIQVVNVRWFNATAWYGLSLAGLLERAGHETLALVLPDTEPHTRAKALPCATRALDLNTANPLALAGHMGRLHTLLKDFRPHIVNCHRGEALAVWAMLKAAGHRFALVRTRGDQRPPKANLPNRYLHARMVDALIATNTRTARQCAANLALPESSVAIIPGGVDRRVFAADREAGEAVRRQYGLAAEDLLVGLVGRFDPVKGQRELMAAISGITHGKEAPSQSWRSRIRLMLVGFPASISLERMREWAREYGLESRTVITGRVDNVAEHMNALDLGVVASQGSEAIARAAFEIMGCQVPLVGTDVGVMPDLLSEKALVPVGNAEALQLLLEKALGDASFRNLLQKEQAACMVRFSQEHFLDQTLDIYYKAVSGKNRPA